MISDLKEQAERRAQMAQDRLNTMHGRTEIDDDRGGRYGAIGKPQVNGTAPTVSMPMLPASHQVWAGDPVEPLVDMTDTCGPTFNMALGEAHEVEKAARILAERSVPEFPSPRFATEVLPSAMTDDELRWCMDWTYGVLKESAWELACLTVLRFWRDRGFPGFEEALEEVGEALEEIGFGRAQS